MEIRKKIRSSLKRLVQRTLGDIIYTEESLKTAVLSILNYKNIDADYSISFDANYYQKLHEENQHFINNNWLVNDIDLVLKVKPTVITELACGNGEFSRRVSANCDTVYALDWARSPKLDNLPLNVIYIQKNIVSEDIPKSDLVCSADFLEHLPEETLKNTIEKIVRSATYGYHKIACYDDGHSHLSILPPWLWLYYFQLIDKKYVISDIDFRNSNIDHSVIVISNFNYK